VTNEHSPTDDHLSAQPENHEPTRRGRPFEPGVSGNPNGRPKGSRNRMTVAVEEMLEGNCEALVQKLLEKAMAGDAAALRLCVARLLPVRRDRPVEFALPSITTVPDAVEASSAVLKACADGELTPDEADKVITLIRDHVRMIELMELEPKVAMLEDVIERINHKA
jgi:hypothetical protein